MKRPDTDYCDHVLYHLATSMSSGEIRRHEIEAHREVIEDLLLLDFEEVREDLVGMYPSRPGGITPRDPVVMLRSVFLAVRLGKGRFNAWGRRLRGSAVLRIMLGLAPEAKAPSIGAHYAFCRRVLHSCADAPQRSGELARGHRGVFERADLCNGRAGKPKAPPQEGAVEQMRRRLLAADTEGAFPRTLDGVLIDWLVRIGLRCLSNHGVLDQDSVTALDLAIDGTVHKSQGRPGGRSLGGGDTTDGADVRVSSDPDATFRYSNGSRSLEFGHLGLAATIRIGVLDVPVLSALAAPGQGETPAMMQALAHLHESLGRHAPNFRIRSLIGDAGFDAAGFYRFAHTLKADPIVALNPSNVSVDPIWPRAHDGTTPLCAGGLEMKRHQRQGDSIVWRCPARCLQRQPDGTKAWTFNAAVCPFAESCTDAPLGPFLSLAVADNPRQNLPVPRHSPTFRTRMASRTSVERFFAHQHHAIPDRTWRRRHLWQIGCAMHALARQAAAVRATQRERLDQFWAHVLPDDGLRRAA